MIARVCATMFLAALCIAGCQSSQTYVPTQDPEVDRLRSLMVPRQAVVAIHEVLWKNGTTSIDPRDLVPTRISRIVVNEQSFQFSHQVDPSRLNRRPNPWVTNVVDNTGTTVVPYSEIETLSIQNQQVQGRESSSVVTIGSTTKKDAIVVLIIAPEDRAKLTAALQVLSPALKP